MRIAKKTTVIMDAEKFSEIVKTASGIDNALCFEKVDMSDSRKVFIYFSHTDKGR